MARSPRQLGFRFKTWGGARAGAGRPPNGERAGASHLRRPSHSRHHPLHVTLKVKRGLPSLREQALFVRVRAALAAAKQQFGFSLVHFSVQRDHLHLIAEAEDRRALSRGVQGLAIRVALAVNHRLKRKGRLFADRYHARALKTPREVRLALRYVLLNARKHARASQSDARRGTPRRSTTSAADVPAGFIDSRSSAPWFSGFSRPAELAFGTRQARANWQRLQGSEAPPIVAAGSGLLRKVLRQSDLFDVDDTPGGC